MTRHEALGILCAAGGMLVLDGSFAVSSLLIGYPTLASQALGYLLATIALGLIARQRGLLALRPILADLTWLCAVALTGLVGFNLYLLAALPAPTLAQAAAILYLALVLTVRAFLAWY